MEKAISVTQLNTYIKQIFEAEEMLSFIKVIGEVSGLSISKGIAYFTLKDENAQLPCVCFSPNDFSFQNGDKVYVTGSPRYYVKGGRLNFNVTKIEQAGLGELYQKFLMLKDKLNFLGYFSEERKKAIPKCISRIGVVTSAEGAVIQDIINIRNRRNPKIDIVLYPVKVQGKDAEYEIAKGIEFFDNYNVDVVIVGRGGGSLEDLMAFNTEVVANAIYYSTKPIVSAVGHETDFTICDFVSDLRAPTPSAASEILCENLQDKRQKAKLTIAQLNQTMFSYLNDRKQNFKQLLISLVSLISTNVAERKQKAKTLCLRLESSTQRNIEDCLYKFGIAHNKLNKLNPNEILKLGYATVRNRNNYINSINNINKGDEIDVCLKDGKFTATVVSIGENNGI